MSGWYCSFFKDIQRTDTLPHRQVMCAESRFQSYFLSAFTQQLVSRIPGFAREERLPPSPDVPLRVFSWVVKICWLFCLQPSFGFQVMTSWNYFMGHLKSFHWGVKSWSWRKRMQSSSWRPRSASWVRLRAQNSRVGSQSFWGELTRSHRFQFPRLWLFLIPLLYGGRLAVGPRSRISSFRCGFLLFGHHWQTQRHAPTCDANTQAEEQGGDVVALIFVTFFFRA